MKKNKHKTNKVLVVLTSLLYFPLSLLITLLLTSQIKAFTNNVFVRGYVDLAVIVFMTLALIESIYKFLTGKSLGGLIYLFGGVTKAESIRKGINESEKVLKKMQTPKTKTSIKEIKKNMINWIKKNWKNILMTVSGIVLGLISVLSMVTDLGIVWVIDGINIIPYISTSLLAIGAFIAQQLEPYHKTENVAIYKKHRDEAKLESTKVAEAKALIKKEEVDKLMAEKADNEKIAKAKAMIEKETADCLAKEKAEKDELEIKLIADKMKAEKLEKETIAANLNKPIA